MTEISNQRYRSGESTNLIVDINTYRKEGADIIGGSDQKGIDYAPGILRFIDALVLDIVHQEWEGKEPTA